MGNWKKKVNVVKMNVQSNVSNPYLCLKSRLGKVGKQHSLIIIIDSFGGLPLELMPSSWIHSEWWKVHDSAFNLNSIKVRCFVYKHDK